MTTEDQLKELILKRYHSVREFAFKSDIPYTTIHSIFKRGVSNSSVANIIKICKALGISADALADGDIAPIKRPICKNPNEYIEVKEVLDDTKDFIINNGFIMLEGKPINKAGIDSIVDALDVGVEIAKKKNKSK